MRDDTQRLLDILEAIERIDKHSGIARAVFDSDELVQTWMVHNIQIIGEAAATLSDEFRMRHSEVPWRAIASMRNVIVHAYFRLDLDEVWSAVQGDLPSLKAQVEDILKARAPNQTQVD